LPFRNAENCIPKIKAADTIKTQKRTITITNDGKL
jgi:hypothetical protein